MDDVIGSGREDILVIFFVTRTVVAVFVVVVVAPRRNYLIEAAPSIRPRTRLSPSSIGEATRLHPPDSMETQRENGLGIILSLLAVLSLTHTPIHTYTYACTGEYTHRFACGRASLQYYLFRRIIYTECFRACCSRDLGCCIVSASTRQGKSGG